MDGTYKRAWWWWWWSLVLVVMVVVCGAEGASRAKLVQNGYEGVVVGISQAVKEEDGPALVEAITNVLVEASRRLFRASKMRAFFREASILIPRDWTIVNTTHEAVAESFETSDIRVDTPSSTYKHQPYTVQSGGCGDPGQYIHLTPEYLLDDKVAQWHGPRGKAVLLEWAKYRWGVFDELGYPGDPLFPLFYTSDKGRVTATYCANRPVAGRQIDKRDLTSCRKTSAGTPDDQCRFVPSPDQSATSSLLSYTLIRSEKLSDFCGLGDRLHNKDAPTKQNYYCKGRPAWDVILSHTDFKDENNPPTESFDSLTVRVVRQEDAHFALVLDYSGSMNDHNRVHKLRRTARRWLLHEVAEGSHVAIIKFSKKATLVHRMEQITSYTRKRLADAIETKADGGTSIGAGLSVAATNVLAGKSNPVIILITDGAENENPRIGDVMGEVRKSGARVITVAFGAAADPNLEKVAEWTGGKTFTVNDIDEGQMLEDAFLGALTYQPPPPLFQQPQNIHEKEYKGADTEASATFLVDFTVGRNLTLMLETGTPTHSSQPSLKDPQVTLAPVLIAPDGQRYTNANFDPDSSIWTLVVPMAEVGEWRWHIGLSGQRDSFVRARVTSLPRNPDVRPITTRAWVSSGAQVNATTDQVIIYAEVKQGNDAVVDADVRAQVTPPGENDPPTVYRLLDNGQGADTLAGDGIYSRYMTKYPSTGRYSVKAQVTNKNTTKINKSLLTSPDRRRKKRQVEEMDWDEYVRHILSGPDYCCGSVVPVAPDAPLTGPFTRSDSGGSVRVTSVPQGDVLPPGRVTDLRVKLMGVGWAGYTLPTHAQVFIAFTAPGDDLDAGTVAGYELRMSTHRENLTEEDFNNTSSSSSSSGTSSSSSSWRVVDLSGYPVQEGGSAVSLNLSLTLTSSSTFFTLRAFDEAGGVSEFSNIAYLHLDTTPRSPTHPSMMLVAVVVVVVVLCLLVVVLMLCLAKRRRKFAVEKLDKDRERMRYNVNGEKEGGTEYDAFY